ncbi:hypothetical protein SAMN04490357_0717 [Streptomyces misionensis]|uniref:Uncharacterized protein n=1 Tax=Streptomyces misionensis TaxID=67331 RepID=A0A1H4NA07_9ACTN|nr:hypothetical protein SAMN04490357_0717 [Streptomyces misionensis]SFY47428.1 hypothetical protein STEPF1_00639 [Streptomyces sp. F-1]
MSSVKRGVGLLGLFLIPLVWGAVDLVGSLTASSQVLCPGENVGADGEERPGPMRPGDTRCSVLDGSHAVATRTYEEQRWVQSDARHQDAGNGILLMAYGATGTLLTWRYSRVASA